MILSPYIIPYLISHQHVDGYKFTSVAVKDLLKVCVGIVTYNLPSVLMVSGDVVLKKKISTLWLLRGYIDGLKASYSALD